MWRFSFIFLLIFFLGFWTNPSTVKAEESDPFSSTMTETPQNASQEVPDLAEEVDLSQIRSFLERLDQDVENSLPGFSLAQTFDDLKSGKLNFNLQSLIKVLVSFLGKEMLESAPLIGKLLILAVLIAVLQQLQVAFEGNVGKMAQLLSYLALLSLALASFQTAINLSKDAIDQMVGLMQSSFPVMLTLLLAMGNFTTAAIFKPMVIGSLTFLATLIKTVVLPLFYLSAVLRMFNHISEQFKLSKLAGLMEFVGKVGLGLVLTLFLGVMSVQGVTGGVADGVALRTAKYSVDLIPVVGKAFKDAVELVVTSGLLLKNAVGIIAILALAVICLGPLIKIVAMIFTFKISAALIEPLGVNALANSMQDMAKSLTFIFGAVASVAIMFFITVAVIVGSGNLSIMLR